MPRLGVAPMEGRPDYSPYGTDGKLTDALGSACGAPGRLLRIPGCDEAPLDDLLGTQPKVGRHQQRQASIRRVPVGISESLSWAGSGLRNYMGSGWVRGGLWLW